MREVAESWPKLSSAQRRQVEPFFTPPAAKGSWRPRERRHARALRAQRACGLAGPALANGGSFARKDGHVRVWWHAAEQARFGARARAMVEEAEDTIWRKLWPVFGRDAVRDGGENCFHGGDGKLDVYLIHRGEGQAHAKAIAINYPGACSAAAIHRLQRRGQPADPLGAGPRAHPRVPVRLPGGGCSSGTTSTRRSRRGARQYIYPRDDHEHGYAWFTKEPNTPLADASYDGWVFPYALEQLYGPGVMQRIYEQGATQEAMHAIDAGVPGGLAKAYPEFAKLAWNHDPVKPSFWEWDGFDPVPEDVRGGEILPEQVDLGAAGQPRGAPHAAAETALTRVQAPEVRAGHARGERGRAVRQGPARRALIKLRDGTGKTEDLTKRRVTVFCPESTGQRIAESSWSRDTSTFRQMAQDKPIRSWARTSAARVTSVGDRHADHNTQSANTTEKWNADRPRLPALRLRLPGGERLPPYHLVGGTVEWSFSGTNGGCSYNAGTATLQIKPDGSMGSLNVHSWHIYREELVRGYYALGWNLRPSTEPSPARTARPAGHVPPAYVARVRRPVPRSPTLPGTACSRAPGRATSIRVGPTT